MNFVKVTAWYPTGEVRKERPSTYINLDNVTAISPHEELGSRVRFVDQTETFITQTPDYFAGEKMLTVKFKQAMWTYFAPLIFLAVLSVVLVLISGVFSK